MPINFHVLLCFCTQLKPRCNVSSSVRLLGEETFDPGINNITVLRQYIQFKACASKEFQLFLPVYKSQTSVQWENICIHLACAAVSLPTLVTTTATAAGINS